jgi:C4-type Zn-finger protein
MRSGVCPVCGHATVYSGRDLPAKRSHNNTIPIDFRNSVPIDNYVCISCGYIERYISDPDALKKIQAQWSPAGKNKRKR